MRTDDIKCYCFNIYYFTRYLKVQIKRKTSPRLILNIVPLPSKENTRLCNFN